MIFSASVWYNQIPISLFQRPKTPNSMISWFLDLLLMAFIGQLMALLANEWPNWWLTWMFPLRIGIIKSRFHYFRGPKLQISWFLSVSTRHRAPKPTLFIFGERPGHLKKIKNSGNILGKYYFCKYENHACFVFYFRKFHAPCFLFWNL